MNDSKLLKDFWCYVHFIIERKSSIWIKKKCEYWKQKAEIYELNERSEQIKGWNIFHQINLKTIWLKPWHRNGSLHFIKTKQIINIFITTFMTNSNRFSLIDSNLDKIIFTEYFNGRTSIWARVSLTNVEQIEGWAEMYRIWIVPNSLSNTTGSIKLDY